MSVTAMYTGKATHTGISTLPGSATQCSRIPSSRSSHVDFVPIPACELSATIWANAFSAPSGNALSLHILLFLLFPLSAKQTD